MNKSPAFSFSIKFSRLQQRLRGIPDWLWAILFFAALTVLMTWPLAARMQDEIVGQVGDNIYFVWMIGWLKKALFDLHVNPLNVWFLNYPEGWSLAYTEITPAMILMALPFTFVGGATFAYNMAMLLTFVLSGIGMYLWVKHLTGSAGAALIAGMIFAFLPYRFAHFVIGHLNLSGTQWLPLYFWGFFELLQRTDGGKGRTAVWTGIALGLIGLTSQYYLYMTLLVSGFLAGCWLVLFDRGLWKQGAYWRTRAGQLVWLAAAALPLVLLAIAPYISLNRQGGLPDRGLAIVRMYSASPTDFLLPSTDHFLWGGWVGANFNREMWVEGTLYIGAVSGALGLVALWRRRKEHLVLGLLLGGAFALMLAMGTDLHWLGEPVVIHWPGFLAKWLQRTESLLRLPGYWMFLHFPFYAKLRAVMRFGVIVLVFSSVAAGLGAGWLLGRTAGGIRKLIAVLLLVLVFLDFYPGPYRHFAAVKARPVDYWLAEQSGGGAVIQFPFIQSEDQEQTYYTLIHGKPFVGGFFNAFPPPQYQRIRPIMEKFPDEESVSLLPALGVRYVLVNRRSYADILPVKQECQRLGLTYLTELGDELVFEVR